MGWNMKISGLTWSNVKDVCPYCQSLSKVIANNPREFASNLRDNLLTSGQLMNPQIFASLFCMVSLLFLSKTRSNRWHKNFVVATIFAVAISNVFTISLAFVTYRHLLIPISLLNFIREGLDNSVAEIAIRPAT